MKKRLLPALLALAMVLTMLPMAAFAEVDPNSSTLPTTGNWTDGEYTLDGETTLTGDITVETDQTVTLNLGANTLKTEGFNIIVKGSLTINGESGGSVTNSVDATKTQDENGKTIDDRKTIVEVEQGGTLVINGGTYKTAASQIVYNNGGTTTINDGTFTKTYNNTSNNTAYDGHAILITGGSGASLTIKKATVTEENGAADYCGVYGVYSLDGGAVTLGKETVDGETADNSAITITTMMAPLGSNFTQTPANFTVNCGTYTMKTADGSSPAKFNAAFYMAAQGTYVINDGVFACSQNGNTSFKAISIPYVDAAVNLTINGGTFTGGSAGTAIELGTEHSGEARQLSITGGTFSSDVSDYVAEGKVCVKDASQFVIKDAPKGDDQSQTKVEIAEGENGGQVATATDKDDTVSVTLPVDENTAETTIVVETKNDLSQVEMADDTNDDLKTLIQDASGVSITVTDEAGNKVFAEDGNNLIIPITLTFAEPGTYHVFCIRDNAARDVTSWGKYTTAEPDAKVEISAKHLCVLVPILETTENADTLNALTNDLMESGMGQKYDVAVNTNNASAGSATADVETAAAGETVTITPDAKAGFEFQGLIVNGKAQEAGKTTFTMPAGNVTVTAYFKATGSVTYANKGLYGGTLTLSGLNPGTKYVCQMAKADSTGKEVGANAIVIFTAEGATQEIPVLGNENGGYLVTLKAYPGSGTINDLDELIQAFYEYHAKA